MLENVLVFDIETVADIEGYRRLNKGLPSLDDQQVYQLMSSERHAEAGTSFMRHHLHKVVAISVMMRSSKGTLKLWTLGDESSPESEIISRFFNGIEHYQPTLVSWNGSGFDLPVLHYRAMIHNVSAPRYFEIGDLDRDYRYNNYISRFHWRHIDVMDVLSGFQQRSVASLNDIAKLCGFPGKLEIDGAAVQSLWDDGNIADIRHYCETDVLNTYLVYLRFERLRGLLSTEAYEQSMEEVKELLSVSESPHLSAFLDEWFAQEGLL